MISSRVSYWRAEAEKAAVAVNRWFRDNAPLAWGDSAGLAARNAEGFLRRALAILDKPPAGIDEKRLDALVAPLIDGAYRQIDTPPPRWSDPVLETWRDIKTTAKETATSVTTWGAGGAALGLVLVGAAWLVLTGRVSLRGAR